MDVTKPSERLTSAGGATSTSGSSASFFKVSNLHEGSAAGTVIPNEQPCAWFTGAKLYWLSARLKRPESE